MRAALLDRLNPLAKVAGPAPAMLLVVAAQDPWLPGTFLTLVAVALLAGSRVPVRRLLTLGAGLVVSMPVLVALFAVAPARALTEGVAPLVAVGPVAVYTASLNAGTAVALKIAALLGLALLGGLTTSGPDLVRALVQNARLPYRFGYAALAAYRFVPRYQHELAVIRAAQRVRGVTARGGPLGALRRAASVAVPLLAGGIRHAERVSMAMEARAFGAHADRTERTTIAVRPVDVVFTVACWLLTVASVVALSVAGLRAPFTLFS